MMQTKVGLILCAGKGTRLKEETKDKPKCMVDIMGKPVLEYIASHMNSYGISRIIVNLHTFPDVVMKYFGQRFFYLYEPVPTGETVTTDIVRSWFPDEVLIVMNGDTLTEIDLNEVSNRGWSGRVMNENIHMGTTIWYPGIREPQANGDLKTDCWWQDMGTPAGLRAARKHYER